MHTSVFCFPNFSFSLRSLSSRFSSTPFPRAEPRCPIQRLGKPVAAPVMPLVCPRLPDRHLRGMLGHTGSERLPAACQNWPENRQDLPVDISAPLCHYPAMLGKTQDQSPATRAARSPSMWPRPSSGA
jgi:hypothetical protein